MKILHISDIHYETNEDIHVKSIFNALRRDRNNDVDFVVISGDLINRGGIWSSSIDQAFKCFDENFMTPLMNSLNIKRYQVIFAPGNHDIDIKTNDCVYDNSIKEKLKTEKDITEMCKRIKEKEDKFEITRLKAYKKYVREFYKNEENVVISDLEESHIVKYENKKIGFGVINTAWRCCGEEEEVLIGELQITNLRNMLMNCDLKIAIMHHSLEDICEYDRNECEKKIYASFDILLKGHKHQDDIKYIEMPNNEIVVLQAGQFNALEINNENKKYQISYSEILFDNNLEILKSIKIYKYNSDSFTFCCDKDNSSSREYSLKLKYAGKNFIDNNIYDNEVTNIKEVNDYILKEESNNVLSYDPIIIQKDNLDIPILEVYDKFFSSFINIFKSKKDQKNLIFFSVLATRICHEHEIEIRTLKETVIEEKRISWKAYEDIINIVDEMYIKCIKEYEKGYAQEYFKSKIVDLFPKLEKSIEKKVLETVDINYEIFESLSEKQKLISLFLYFYINLNNLRYKEKVVSIESRVESEFENCIKEMYRSGEKKYNVYGTRRIGKSKFLRYLYKKKQNDRLSANLFFSIEKYRNIEEWIEDLKGRANELLLNKISILGSDKLSKQVDINLVDKIIDLVGNEYKYVNIFLDDVNGNNFVDLFKNLKSNCYIYMCSRERSDLGDKAGYLEMPLFKYDNANWDIPKDTIMKLNYISNTRKDNAFFFELMDTENRNEIICKIDQVYEIDQKNVFETWRNECNKFILDRNNLGIYILLILTIFNNIVALKIEELQKILLFLGIKLMKPQICLKLNRTNKLFKQLDDCISIDNDELCNFLRKEYFSDLDYNQLYIEVLNWLFDCNNINVELLASFVRSYYERGTLTEYSKFEQYMNKFKERDDGSYLFEIGLNIFKNMEQDKKAIELISLAAHKNNDKAILFLAEYYTQWDNNFNIIEGEKYFKTILNKENVDNDVLCNAKMHYAICIFNNIFNSDSYDTAMNLLSDIIKESKNDRLLISAKTIYTYNIIRGYNGDMSKKEAINALSELAKKDKIARRDLACIFYYGLGVKRNEKEAICILSEKSANDDDVSLVLKANIYLYGGIQVRNVQKGRELLEKLVEKGNEKAIIEYSTAVFHGLIDDSNENIFTMLKKLIEKGNDEAKKLYYIQKFEGDVNNKYYLQQLLSIKKGYSFVLYDIAKVYCKNEMYVQAEEYLKKAMEYENLNAYFYLSRLYLNNELEIYNKQEGVKLLKYCATKNFFVAKYTYAKYIIENGGNISLAIEYLKDAVNNSVESAITLMAECYEKGNGVEQNLDKAEQLYIQAAQYGDENAIFTLIQKYMYGGNFKQDISKVESMFKLAYFYKEYYSVSFYAKKILEKKINKSNNEAIALLEEGVKNNCPFSKMQLGECLINGIGTKCDVVRGKELLEEASVKLPSAKQIIARYYLSGMYYEKDVIKGEKLLYEAAEKDENIKLDVAIDYLEGNLLKKNLIKGQNLLRELYMKGNIGAKIEYAKREIEGMDEIKKKEGEKTIRFLASKNLVAKRVLFVCAIEKKLEMTSDEINNLFKDLHEQKDTYSMLFYANKALEQRILDLSVKDAKKLFLECIELGDAKAKYYYAKYLINGDILERDVIYGKRLLEELICTGDIPAKYYYAQLNIENYVFSDYDLGWKYMKELEGVGYEPALLYLANAYMKGSFIKQNIDYGKKLYLNLIEKGNECAMLEYSNLLYNGIYCDKNIKEANDILKKICQEPELSEAKYQEYKRLIEEKKGKKNLTSFFVRALKDRNSIYNFEYAIRLRDGNGIKQNRLKGENLLKNMDIHENDKARYARKAYDLGDNKIASQLYIDALKATDRQINNSIAYLLRRNELIVKKTDIYNVKELLQKELDGNSYIAKVNYALYLAQNQEWEKADGIIRSLRYYSDDIDWWIKKMDEKDTEGYLVVAWIGKYYKDNLFFKQCNINQLLDVAQEEWNIPDWMYE